MTSRRSAIERRAGERRRFARRHITLPLDTERRRGARRVAGVERRARADRRAKTDRRDERSRLVGALAVTLAMVGGCIRLIREAEALDPLLRVRLLDQLANIAVRINQAILDGRAIRSHRSPTSPP